MFTNCPIIELATKLVKRLEYVGYSQSYISDTRDLRLPKLQRYMERRNTSMYTEALGYEYLQEVLQENVSSGMKNSHKRTVRHLNDILLGNEYHWHVPVKRTPLTAFDDILSNFEQRLIQTGRSENTIRDRTTDVHRFLGYLEENGIETLKAVKPEIIFSAYEAINGKRHFSASMPTFLRFAYKEGLVGEDYSKVVPKTVIPQRTPSVYTEEEIAAILAVPNRETPGGMRDYAILVIQSKCGIRCCDMAALKLENINLPARRTSFVQSKTSVPVSFPMDDAIAEALRLYLENGRPRNNSEYLFLSINAPHRPITSNSCSCLAQKCFKKSGVDLCGRSHGGHAFRSSLASNLVNTNVAYTIVQNVLGQKDVNTVKEYAKIDIERLRICALEVPPAAGALKELLEGSGNG